MVKEVVIKPVNTAQPIQQVPGTQQPDRHEQVLVQDPIASQNQVQLGMANNNSILLSPITDTSCDVLDLAQKEVVVKPVDTSNGMEDDVPDLVYKKVAI